MICSKVFHNSLLTDILCQSMFMKKPVHHEKYDSTNPIAQKLINGFMQSIEDLVTPIADDIHRVTECGCGQGHVNQALETLLPGAKIRGFDIDADEVAVAESNKRRENTLLLVKSIYDLDQTELKAVFDDLKNETKQ